ncbi:AB hydrolase-1 domain-containing protein [Favolaschia claudopus]|uniref:AB hydrolase-1 domain-containing protein n=1 Tax=Favolaschia claudopus TaxID=2862362 RepID=A0AAW0D195_9AGAR
MPRIELETSSGRGSFYYNIATPTETSASAIMQAIPTIVLIHPVYTASVIFHLYYANPELRRFNLVSMDLRGHGWTSATVDDSYGSEIVADDVLKLMNTLKIDTCHVAGIATGGSIALQMAVAAPERILSIFMMSPGPQVEPIEGMQGRREIARYWIQARQPDASEADKKAADDAIYGTLQLAYSNIDIPLVRAIRDYSVQKAEENWTGVNLHWIEVLTLKFLDNQPVYTVETLERIRCPVLLVHCTADVVYPKIYAEELLDLFHSANVDASLEIIEGAPHWGSVTHPDETNEMLYNFVIAHCDASNMTPPPNGAESPFLNDLAPYGLLDTDSDLEHSE